MNGSRVGLVALLLTVGSGISPASSQVATVLSQTYNCYVEVSTRSVDCSWNVLIIDTALDRRVACYVGMAVSWEQYTNPPPILRYVNPTLGPKTKVDCFIQPGLGVPHPNIAEISTRGEGTPLAR
jgi:hypothetical protein